jgi:hypothetical protein
LHLHASVVFYAFSSYASSICAFQLELLSAKYLIGANLDGSSDPFAVISCADQKRFRWSITCFPLHPQLILQSELVND